MNKKVVKVSRTKKFLEKNLYAITINKNKKLKRIKEEELHYRVISGIFQNYLFRWII